MKNIFIDREKEVKFLQRLKAKNFFLVVVGRRRIGKTTLLLRAFPDAAYIFVWPNKSINWIIEEVCREFSLPSFKKFSDIVEYLLDQGKIVILDEFQNFLKVDKSVYGEFQKLLDLRKIKGKQIKIVACGSSYSLINRVFKEEASPLYGRRTHELRVGNLPIRDLFKWTGRPLEEFIEIWSVFEGVPYYYEFLDPEKSAKENIKNLLLSKDALLKEEGNVVLSVEFGRDAKIYYTILSAIAEGKRKLSEIASLFDNKPYVVTKYLEKLRKSFGLVRRKTPILDDPKRSKEGYYEMVDNFLNFWFRFIERNRALIEQNREEELIRYFEQNFNSYVGEMFEKFVLELAKTFDPFRNFTKIGRQWGKVPDKPKGRNQYEIDLIGLNEEEKEILFGEVKWKGQVDAQKIVRVLAEKSRYVTWYNKERREGYAVFAKSFSRRIKEFNGKKVYCFDLRDLERVLTRKT